MPEAARILAETYPGPSDRGPPSWLFRRETEEDDLCDEINPHPARCDLGGPVVPLEYEFCSPQLGPPQRRLAGDLRRLLQFRHRRL